MHGRHAKLLGRIAFCVVLLHACLLSTIPAGMMPVVGPDGSLRLVLCPVEIASEPHHAMGHQPGDPEEGGAGPADTADCEWAGSSPVGLVPHAPLPIAALRMAAPPLHRAETVLAIARKTGLPPSTGPPGRA